MNYQTRGGLCTGRILIILQQPREVWTQKKLEKKWEFLLGESVLFPPIVVGNRVVFCCDDGRLYALESGMGYEHWNLHLHEKAEGSPALLGNILVAPSGNKMYSIDWDEMYSRFHEADSFER